MESVKGKIKKYVRKVCEYKKKKMIGLVVTILNWWNSAQEKESEEMENMRYELWKNQMWGKAQAVMRKIERWIDRRVNKNIRQCKGNFKNTRGEWKRCINPAKNNSYREIWWNQNLCVKHQEDQQAEYLGKHLTDHSRINKYSRKELATAELKLRKDYTKKYNHPVNDGHQEWEDGLERIINGGEPRSNNNYQINYENNYNEENEEMMEEENINDNENEMNNHRRYDNLYENWRKNRENNDGNNNNEKIQEDEDQNENDDNENNNENIDEDWDN